MKCCPENSLLSKPFPPKTRMYCSKDEQHETVSNELLSQKKISHFHAQSPVKFWNLNISKASAHYDKQTKQWDTVNLFIREYTETVINMLKSHPVTLASEFIIWLSHYFFPHSCCSVKRAGSQDLPKFRMGPCHTPHRSTMCLQENRKTL